MKWSDVGSWLKDNAGNSAVLVGSLLTGNVPGAVAAGVAMVSSATGSNDPSTALATLQGDPTTLIRLKELAVQEAESIRKHLEEMTRLQLEDEQKEHTETQTTIRAGDAAEDRLVRWTRPLQSWISLIFAGVYAWQAQNPTEFVFVGFMTLPFTYMGLRQFGKWKEADLKMRAESK